MNDFAAIVAVLGFTHQQLWQVKMKIKFAIRVNIQHIA